jgi:hypothetical protein
MLPQPKKWRRSQNLLAVPRNLKVRRPAKLFRPSQSDQARSVDRAVNGFLAKISHGKSATELHRNVLKALEIDIPDGGLDGPDGVPLGGEAYKLDIGPETIQLAATDGPGLRAGLVTLTQLVVAKDGGCFLPADQILDWPDLPLRGFHVDLTFQTLSFEYICSLLERLAACKYNAMLIEWGDKFPYQGHRTLSHPDALSPRQVSSLLELAESLGVVVIPLVQTLGHAEFILRHPQFAHLSEVPGDIYQLATGNPESLVLAKQLVDQLIESHPSSPYVHLGADEATQLGESVSAEQVARKGLSLVWVEYMNVICRHVQARGRTPVVWDDMLLGHPEALNRFTRDCLLMHWNYTAAAPIAADFTQPGVGRINAKTYPRLDLEVRERFDRFWAMGGARPPKTFFTPAPVVYLQEAGFKVILAPSVRSFGDGYGSPRLRQHIDNGRHMAQSAASLNSLGLMVTSWSIRRTGIETTMPALLAAADAAWNGGKAPLSKGSVDHMLAEQISASASRDLIKTLDLLGQSGLTLFNGVGPTYWDRRRDRMGISPILGRVRKADLGRLTGSAPQVKLARRLLKQARQVGRRIARVAGSPKMHPSFMHAWRYAARELAHKAAQWLYLWQVVRFVRVDRGAGSSLAKQGAALLEDIRRCARDCKRALGPTMTPGGLEDELDIRFGGEARLVRRVVRVLRSDQSRLEIRAQLAGLLGLAVPGGAEK